MLIHIILYVYCKFLLLYFTATFHGSLLIWAPLYGVGFSNSNIPQVVVLLVEKTG